MQMGKAFCYRRRMENITHNLLLAHTSPMNHPTFAVLEGHSPAESLVVVFAFVIVIVVIKNMFQMRQSRLWHETARAALEKGQSLPPGAPSLSGCSPSNWYCGLVWIAVGVGLYLVNDCNVRNWAALPICIGAALLLASLINTLLQSSKSGDKNPA